MPASPVRLRPLFLLGTALVIALVSCGRDATAPAGATARFARGLSFNARFPDALQQASGGAASIVPFTRVRVVLYHANGAIALDTVITFPTGSDQVTLGLTVPLLSGAPADGEPMSLNLAYINAAGDTVFRGGPVAVLAVPSSAGQPAPVQVPVTYSGPGAAAKTVKISPKTLSVTAGDNFAFSAAAADGNGVTLPNTPIVWTTLDPALATLPSAAAGSGASKVGRGTARIVAQLLTASGTDTATLTVLPKASTIAAVSGVGQSGAGGVALGQPVVVVVTATDLLPMAGVTVTFAAANGGTVGAPTATTDASGRAQTTWTLGAITGLQTLTATAAGLTGSPVTFTATSTSGSATKLVVTTPPADGITGAVLPALVITAQDAGGNAAKGFTGAVTLAIGTNPGGGTLGGTTTMNAVAGVASFATLTISKAGVGYTLIASASGLTPATTTPFTVSVPAAALLGLVSGGGQTGPAGSTLPVPIVVQVVDASGIDIKDAGLTVTFASTTGGGSVSPLSAITDSLGRASVAWTLGPAAGVQTMTASSLGLAPIVVRATATPSVGQLRVWNGSADTSWTNPVNWTPNGVPGFGDSVVVRSSVFQPVITAPVSIKSLVVGQCRTIRLKSTLTISANLSDSSWFCDAASARMPSRRKEVGQSTGDGGIVVLTGDGVLGAYVLGDLIITGGTHTMTISSQVIGDMDITGNGKVIVNGKQLTISGDLSTSGSATLQMTNASDYLYVNGSALFAGGSETGLLSAGTLYLYGDLIQAGGSPSAFAPSGTHQVILYYGGAQTVSFANPSTSFFQELSLYTGSSITLMSDVTVKGTLGRIGTFSSLGFTSAGANTLTVSGLNLFGPGANTFVNVVLRYVDGVPGSTTFNQGSFIGLGPGATFFEFARTSGGPYNFSNLTFNGVLNASGRYIVNTGTSLLTLINPNPNSTAAPSACGCVNYFTAGTGGIVWP